MCMVFVFAALLEYAFVNVMARKDPKDDYKKTDHPDDVEEAGAVRTISIYYLLYSSQSPLRHIAFHR